MDSAGSLESETRATSHSSKVRSPGHHIKSENIGNSSPEMEDGQDSDNDDSSISSSKKHSVYKSSDIKSSPSNNKKCDESDSDPNLTRKKYNTNSKNIKNQSYDSETDGDNSKNKRIYKSSHSDKDNSKINISEDFRKGEFDRHGNRRTYLKDESKKRDRDSSRDRKQKRRQLSRDNKPDNHRFNRDNNDSAEYYKPVETPIPNRAQRTLKTGGGRYIPPARLREIEAQNAALDGPSREKSKELEKIRQKESWEKLKKGIRGLINKVNVGNIKEISSQIFNQNLIRGRGLFCRYIFRAQAQSQTFTPVYSALVSVVNSRLPILGELLVNRLVIQFRKSYQRDDKARCIATTQFLAHLTNQRIAHEILAFQILQLLLENPTDDSVEIAVGFMKEVGSFLSSIAPRVLNAVIETFRSILHEADIDKRSQYMIEVLLQVRREGFKDNVSVPEGLDLVEEDDQIVHEVSIEDDTLEVQDELDVFKFDENFEENEEKYNSIKQEILGDSDDSESGSDDSNSSEDEEDTAEVKPDTNAPIKDLTETELLNLRRTIYLTIMSSMGFEEATHKLLRIQIPENDTKELCGMLIECCSQERAYKTFFGLVGERLCKVNNKLRDAFCYSFVDCYIHIHRYETNHLRHIARFFGHLLSTDAIPFTVFSCVSLTEEETTASSRIFLKILMQDLSESMGLERLNSSLHSSDAEEATSKMFPTDSPKNIRFAINYYTSIGLGALTEDLRRILSTATQNLANNSDSDSSSDDDSSSDSDSSSSSSYDSDSSTDSSSGSESSSSSSSEPGVSSTRRSARSPLKMNTIKHKSRSSKYSDNEFSPAKSKIVSGKNSELAPTRSGDKHNDSRDDILKDTDSRNFSRKNESQSKIGSRSRSISKNDSRYRPYNTYNKSKNYNPSSSKKFKNDNDIYERKEDSRSRSPYDRSRYNNSKPHLRTDDSDYRRKRGDSRSDSNESRNKSQDYRADISRHRADLASEKSRPIKYSDKNLHQRNRDKSRSKEYDNRSRYKTSEPEKDAYRNNYRSRSSSKRPTEIDRRRSIERTSDKYKKSDRDSRSVSHQKNRSHSNASRYSSSRGRSEDRRYHSQSEGRITKTIPSNPISLLDSHSISLICKPSRSRSSGQPPILEKSDDKSRYDTSKSKSVKKSSYSTKVRSPSHSSDGGSLSDPQRTKRPGTKIDNRSGKSNRSDIGRRVSLSRSNSSTRRKSLSNSRGSRSRRNNSSDARRNTRTSIDRSSSKKRYYSSKRDRSYRSKRDSSKGDNAYRRKENSHRDDRSYRKSSGDRYRR
ncbi:Pre-mRNA-splicing factor CWC22 [Smittium culicis]|uniref:Pre-mRNA-splicing factor CWC22 n=1 Tax=Smittium culicis TaxID=133412 RepID=A0A1R1X0K3_9FUNG|nr:Pre-mRNA-splicing factor CWC22 [Smittium culicis]